jgi:hypothetical protein
MQRYLPFLLVFIWCITVRFGVRKPDQRFYELRIYHTHPGKMSNLITRFQNHTLKLFEKHGMKNIGYWLPIEENTETMYYILSFPSRAARDASWASFVNDPEWKKVAADSEKDGKILTTIESIFLQWEDFSPAVKKSIKKPDRTFELRIYHCLPGKLMDLENRFRNHTLRLFEKHHMTNLPYFRSLESEGKQGRLVYLLAHESPERSKASWDGFRNDPEWLRVKEDSEKAGKIVEKVESILLRPLSFSKYK